MRALRHADIALEITDKGVRVFKVRNDPPRDMPRPHTMRILIRRKKKVGWQFAYEHFDIQDPRTLLAKWISSNWIP